MNFGVSSIIAAVPVKKHVYKWFSSYSSKPAEKPAILGEGGLAGVIRGDARFKSFAICIV